MNSIAHLIRFWILMAVLGSSASGADDPPIFHPPKVSIGKQETAMQEPLKPGTHLMNVVAHGETSRALFTIADPKGNLNPPRDGDIIRLLKGDS